MCCLTVSVVCSVGKDMFESIWMINTVVMLVFCQIF